MAVSEKLNPPSKNSEQNYNYDPKVIRFKSFLALSYLEGKALPEVPRKETTLYLLGRSRKPVEQRISLNYPVSLKNNSDFPVLSLSILFKNPQKHVFFLKELAPKKAVQLEFVREGVFDLFYSFAWDQKIHKRVLKIIRKSEGKSPVPHNFHPDLKSSWPFKP